MFYLYLKKAKTVKKTILIIIRGKKLLRNIVDEKMRLNRSL